MRRPASNAGGRSLTYLPDHEPALGGRGPLLRDGWTSGGSLAEDTDLLIHDGQYTDAQYDERVGWGHSTFDRAVEFARLTRARKLVVVHHDPDQDDVTLARLMDELVARSRPSMPVSAGREGEVFTL